MLTLNKMLELSEFNYLSPLNSQADLNREVNTVETTETPDVAKYLPKHTFLLTTGMAFQDDPEAFCTFMQSLDELPIAGLGIKLGRYIDQLDPEVLAFADELGFPLFKVPEDRTLGSVSHHLLSYIWDNQSGAMESALNLQKQFSEMMLRGASIENLIKYLGSVLKIPVVLKDPFLNIVAVSHQLSEKADILNRFEEDSDAFLDQQLSAYSRKQSSKLLKNDRYYIYPIKLDTNINYYLILSKKEEGGFPLSSLMIEQASVVLSHMLYKNIKVIEKNLITRQKFFGRLVNEEQNRHEKGMDWLEYGKEFGLAESDVYRVMICQFSINQRSSLHQDSDNISYSLLYDWFEKAVKDHSDKLILFPTSLPNSFSLLAQSSLPDLETILKDINEKLKRTGLFDLTFYVGSPVFSTAYIHYSYKEAKESAASGKGQKSNELISYYETKDVAGLFNYIPEHVKRHFCLVNLKELAYPTDDALKELRQTLKTFLDAQSEIKLTSERLFVHRNTVKYRIAKCKELLDSELTGPAETLNIRMALEISEQKK